MKLLRTLVWIELVLVPAGAVLVAYVIPTFRQLVASLERGLPLLLQVLGPLVTLAAYALPLVGGFLWWEMWRWHKQHDVPQSAFLWSLFNLRGNYWQGSRVRVMLKD